MWDGAEWPSGGNRATLHSEMAFLANSYWIDIHSNIHHHVIIVTRDGKHFDSSRSPMHLDINCDNPRSYPRIPRG